MQIERATRVGVVPLIDIFSESGNGKTFSALLLARGIAGPDGLIIGIDTENRRMSLYADIIPGGFNVINLDQPFSPARYIEAIDSAVKAKAAVIVVDSASHEWEGIGSVCDMAAVNEEKSKKAGLHNWRIPKAEHQKFIATLVRIPVPIICCIRAKHKTRQSKGTKEMAESGIIDQWQIGKTVILKEQGVSPIQSEDFIYESTVHLTLNPNHSIVLNKCSHPGLRDCLPKDNTTPIEIKHGEMIAQWCRSATKSPASKPAATTTASAATEDVAAVKKELWELLKPVRGEASNWDKAHQFLWAENILDPATEPAQTVQSLKTVADFRRVIDEVKKKLS